MKASNYVRAITGRQALVHHGKRESSRDRGTPFLKQFHVQLQSKPKVAEQMRKCRKDSTSMPTKSCGKGSGNRDARQQRNSLELAMEISLTSLGSSQTFLAPTWRGVQQEKMLLKGNDSHQVLGPWHVFT